MILINFLKKYWLIILFLTIIVIQQITISSLKLQNEKQKIQLSQCNASLSFQNEAIKTQKELNEKNAKRIKNVEKESHAKHFEEMKKIKNHLNDPLKNNCDEVIIYLVDSSLPNH